VSNSPVNGMELQVRLAPATAQLGRVIHDPRGNAVWDWAIETTTLAQTTVEELLNRLVDPMPLALEGEGGSAMHWGGDPYNRSF